MGLAALVPVWTAGCSSHWVYTFVEAENLARDKEKPIFVLYRDPFDPRSGEMYETVRSPQAAELLKNMICCTLVTEYNPNRRFMAQYGVLEAPAITIIHPDGTYHSRSGPVTLKQLGEFIRQSQGPGAQPNVDIQIPRPTDYLLHAEGDYDAAMAAAARRHRNLLIVYKWWLDPDSTELLHRMARPEVAARVTEAVHCVLDWDYIPNRKHVERYGIARYPALIVVHPDGTSQKLEGLAPVDQIVGFLSRSLAYVTRPRPRPRPSTPRPAVDWQTDFARARVASQRSGLGLFVFCHSPTSNESLRMDAFLADPQIRGIFNDAIRCRVNWSDSRVRKLMAQYGVLRAPGFVAIRPDGAFVARQGVVSKTDLRQMHDYLNR